MQSPDRLRVVAEAFRMGISVDEVYAITSIDKWFLRQIEEIVAAEKALREQGLPDDAFAMTDIKAMGFSDKRLAQLTGKTEQAVRDQRHALDVHPVYKRIDTCAADRGQTLISTRPMSIRCSDRTSRIAKPCRQHAKKSSFWAAARTGSARVSSSITVAAMRPLPWKISHRVDHGELQPGNGVHGL